MKVMTNQMEARGLQSRTEVRQTVAQMAAPNFKDSAPEDSPGQVMIFPRANSYFAPGKLGLCSVQTRTLLRAKSRFASGKLLARRVAMLLILMIGMVGNAWGKETEIYKGSLKNVLVTPTKPEVIKVGTTIHFYLITDCDLYLANSSYGAIFDGQDNFSQWKSHYSFQITTEEQVNYLKAGFRVDSHHESDSERITIESVDAFLNGPRAGYSNLSLPISVSSASDPVTITKPANWPSIDAKYVRWYVVKGTDVYDITGTETTKPHLTGLTGFNTDADHGSYWHSSTATASSGFAFPTLTVPSDKSVEDYQVVAILSTEEGTVSGSDLTKEPLYDVVYTFSFEMPFRGDVSSATKVEKTFKLAASQWGVSPKEFSVDFDFTDSKILLKDKDNLVTLASVTMDESFWATNYPGASVSGKNFYIRWFLKNKSTGVETYIANSICDVNSASTYKDCAKAQYGRFWSTKIGDGQTDLNNIMRIKIDGTPDSPGTEFDIKDYDLVCTIGTNGSETLNTSNQVTMEPATLQMQYTFHFENIPFEAENINDASLKTIYKTAVYDKSTRKISPYLFSNGTTVLNDLGCTADQLKAGYLRWYVADKATGKIVSDLVDWNATGPTYSMSAYYNSNLYGFYGIPSGWYSGYTGFDCTFTMPSGYGENDYKNHQVVCVVTTDKTGITPSTWSGNTALDCEPTNMQVKYVFDLILTEDEIKNLRFVHSKGASGRDFINGTNSNAKQQEWVETTGTAQDASGDIRQGVHTWEYNVYVNDGETRVLVLPFEKYTEVGNDLEPRGYFRWYDWDTDYAIKSTSTYELTKVGSELIEKKETVGETEYSRGYMALYIDSHPIHSLVGVTFDAKTGFNTYAGSDDEVKPIRVACDVSRYFDGIDKYATGKKYLVHEPTLSTRYIFNIYPAKVMYNKLKAANEMITTGEAIIKGEGLDASENTTAKQLLRYAALQGLGWNTGDGEMHTMYNLPEDKGKVVVSLNNGNGNFSLRLDGHSLKNYILDESGTQANSVQWVAYYENNEGVGKAVVKTENARLSTFTSGDFTGKTYAKLDGSGNISGSNGSKFHVVAYVGHSDDPANPPTKLLPVAHYELHFLNAPAILVSDLKKVRDGSAPDAAGSLTTEQILQRTDEYMKSHYELKRIVDFDGNPETNPNVKNNLVDKAQFYSTSNWYDAPTATPEYTNVTFLPREWGDVEYGFVYPQLTKYVAHSDAQLYNTTGAFHSDYQILKSMEAPGISIGYAPGAFNYDATKHQYGDYRFIWWDKDYAIYDYTHEYTDETKYGSLFYTDASDESRTIATIPFDADICSGSSIYFTGAVADRTHSATKPELLVRITYMENGVRKPLIAFHTGDIRTTNAVGYDGFVIGKWYQVYGKSSVPSSYKSPSGTVRYTAEVINYAKNTTGADFAIDQLTIYTKTASVQVKQTDADCNSDVNNIRIFMESEGLKDKFDATEGTHNLYYRICDADGNVMKGTGFYFREGESGSDDGTWDYGIAKVKLDYTDSDLKTKDEIMSQETGWFKDTDGTIYFQAANHNFPSLVRGRSYFVSIWDPKEETFSNYEGYWGGLMSGAKDKCTVYSSDFIPQTQYIAAGDEEGAGSGGSLAAPCGGDVTVTDMELTLKRPNANKATGFEDYTNVHYDFFYGSLELFKSDETIPSSTYKYSQIQAALSHYRSTSAYKTSTSLDAGYATANAENYAILKAAVDAQLLEVGYSTVLTHTFKAGTDGHVTCITVETSLPTVDNPSVTFVTCSPFELMFKVGSGAPELDLGFSDVDYTQATNYTKRVLRVGLEQLNNMKSNGYKLHVPIARYQDTSKGTTRRLYFSSNDLTISAVDKTDDVKKNLPQTTDPTVTAVGTKFATITEPDGTTDDVHVGTDQMYLTLDLSSCAINFHEGYEYEVSTSFFDEEDKGKSDTEKCIADLYLIIKVVPKYVTWHERNLEDDYYSANWNDDLNWKRSTKAELHKDIAGQNTDSYQDANELSGLESATQPANFVPMKFTYVTIPTRSHAPNLTREPLAGAGSLSTGGRLVAGDLITDVSPKTSGKQSKPTENIQFDMLVRYGTGETGEGCKGHPYLKWDGSMDSYLWTQEESEMQKPDDIVKVYDCEKFYGNICKEIYFKPQAELVKQHRLAYEKAWVEKELEPNKWYLMSSPLKVTYAGDIYAPYNNGRQETEAFQPINFSAYDAVSNPTGEYSRTMYPFYQHSWGKDATVNVQSADIRDDYKANLNLAGVTLSGGNMQHIEWGHTYNDVTVPYNSLEGFSIRANRKELAQNSVIRLPKADLTYSYYDYSGVVQTPKDATLSVTKGTNDVGKLVTDGDEAVNPSDDRVYYRTVSGINLQKIGDYYLVGNPYMSSIDMGKFFADNTELEKKYWTYEASVAKVVDATTTGGKVRPMQAFFVKSSSTPEIRFTSDMMIDGNYDNGTTVNPNSTRSPARPRIMLRAASERGSSSASIELSEKASAEYVGAEDVEALFDSNLDDVPMVYTVAGNKAVSIDVRRKLDVVPFGVSCGSSDEMVSVKLSWSENSSKFTVDGLQFTDDGLQLTADNRLYVLDAVTGETTEVTDGQTVSVQPNDYGRYFLTTRGGLTAIQEAKGGNGIVVSVRNKTLTVRSDAGLKAVRIVTVGGETVASAADCGTEASFALANSGVYIVEAQTASGGKTMKAVVR